MVSASPTRSRRIKSPAANSSQETLQDLLDRLGDVAPQRVRMHPWPGTATQRDLLSPENRQAGGVMELVDGILVEKPVGWLESRLATVLAGEIHAYLKRRNLGVVNCGGDGYLKLKRRLIRVPDVSFVSWDRLPDRKSPKEPCPELIADLVVEVLSRGNTRREMARKRADFFARDTKLFWIVDPRKFTVTVYRSETEFRTLTAKDIVEGEDVLPGFRLSIQSWFDMAGLDTN